MKIINTETAVDIILTWENGGGRLIIVGQRNLVRFNLSVVWLIKESNTKTLPVHKQNKQIIVLETIVDQNITFS